MDLIPKPIDIHLLGPRYMPWREAVDYAIGGTAAGPLRSQRDDGSLTNRTLTVVALLAIIVSFVHSYRGVSILPRDAKLGIGWKSPKNVSYFLRSLILLKLQADISRIPSYSLQTALPAVSYRFSFPKMKVVAPRFVIHYFANAGNPHEGVLRYQAQAFI